MMVDSPCGARVGGRAPARSKSGPIEAELTMSTLAGVFATTHSPTCYLPAERWNEVRASRTLRADVPTGGLEEKRRKKARVEQGFAVLKHKLAAVAPAVLAVFGDDQA